MAERSEGTQAGPGTAERDLLAPGLLHELAQPLAGADAAAALLERVRPDLAGLEEWELLRAQLARMAEIVKGYAALVRPDGTAPAPFAVGVVVARAVDLLAHRLRPLGGRFSFARDDGGREGFGVPAALVHAATNLLANALDAAEARGGGARVALRVLARPSGGVEVRVSDEGAGIAAADRARIFEPGFTTKGAGRGEGLGLHLARRLMARQGGEVFLVAPEDPARLPWAVTELCIAVPAPP